MGKIAFVCYWTAFEYFYLNAEISWPWLNLGNGLAFNSHFVQWYEYTGALGGTAWVLAINLLFFEILKKILFGNNRKEIYPALIAWFILLLAPILLSLSIYYRYQEKCRPVDIVVIQPNVDPYSTYIPPAVQCSNITNLIGSTGTDKADYFVAPETAIEDDVWENSIENNYSVSTLKKFMKKFPSAGFVYGSYTYKRYEADDTKTATAQWMKTPGFYFDSYNTALQIDTGKTIQKYHKSKLVVGIEKMPYSNTLKFLRKIVESFGGSFSSHGTQDFRSVFTSPGKETRIAPVICYESVYGEFVTGHINNGANLMFIITNDGWWGNTPGHRQHLAYASLRAIETRRSIARAANTGISAFINQRGDVVKTLEYGKKGTLECSLNANDEKTFYVKHGDYVGWIAVIISGCIALFTIITTVLKRLKH
jgi:apolipoprotein N-acyltransferase